MTTSVIMPAIKSAEVLPAAGFFPRRRSAPRPQQQTGAHDLDEPGDNCQTRYRIETTALRGHDGEGEIENCGVKKKRITRANAVSSVALDEGSDPHRKHREADVAHGVRRV